MLSSFSRISAQKVVKYINKKVPPKGITIIKNKIHRIEIYITLICLTRC